MTVKNLAVQSRTNEFSTIIDNTICTNVNGENENCDEAIMHLTKLMNDNKTNGKAIYIVGNGGSAAVASHALTDFVNACHLRAFTINEPSLITCMANDFGYESSYQRILKSVFRPEDILIAISSSGQSPNIHHAVDTAKALGGTVITLSGFTKENKLRKMGYLNFWLDSHDYGLVEIGHLFLLHNIADRIAMGVNKGVKIDYAAVV
ncbi:MAG: SIS domain-containing protein [Pseudomonadota bacterium]